MLRAASYLPLALLFLASVVPSNGQMRRADAEVKAGERLVTVKLGAPLTIECPLRPEQKAEWRLDGGAKPVDMKTVEASSTAPDALIARLTAPVAQAHHAGVYTCAKSSLHIRVQVTDTETAPTMASEAPATRGGDFHGDVVYYEVRGPLQLNCTLTGKISWKKNDTALDQIPELKEHIVPLELNGVEGAALKVQGRSTEADYGNYTCSNGESELSWEVKARPHAKLATDTNVVEGQKLKLTCRLIGRPWDSVQWTYSNVSEEDNGTDVSLALGSRVELMVSEEGINNATLVIAAAERSDAGWYRCSPVADADSTPKAFTTRLRVKDMYAALWPFLGICAEVFVLCAVILVYEKRRTKPELDDSDTDNHDQKKS